MNSASRNRKRLLIFSVIPLLVAVPFFTDDFILRLIAAVLLVTYSAFIIFLRDSSRSNDEIERALATDEESYNNYVAPEREIEFDPGEDFKIISPNKNIEVLKSDELSSAVRPTSAGTTFFKHPELKAEFDKIALEKIPDNISDDQHFGFALEKILHVIKDAFLAHSALFFWYNPKSNKLTLEKYISVSSEVLKQKFDVEDDVLSKIVHRREPELLTDLVKNAEHDNIRYYSSPQGIKSFIGVPLYYGKSLAGILALDSKENDAWGVETIYSLGRFVRVISLLISLFEEKHSDSKADKRLSSLLEIVATDKKFENEQELFTTIESSVKKLLNWDIFTFVYYHSNERQFKTIKIFNNTSLKYVGENREIDLSGTLVGRAIVNGIPVKIDDTSNEKLARFTRDEDITFGGSFLAVPLAYDGQIYGVFCFDSLKPGVYSNSDVAFVKKAVKIFSYIVYSFSTQKTLKSLLSQDVETRMLNGKSFLKESGSDLEKAKIVKVPASVALIKIDKFIDDESLFESNPFPKVLKSISSIIKDSVNIQNRVGRIGRDVFAIFFFNSDSTEVFLWAEKLRIKIARTPVSVSTKQTTYTVSVGISTAHENTDINSLVQDAELALKKAIEKGGNSVNR